MLMQIRHPAQKQVWVAVFYGNMGKLKCGLAIVGPSDFALRPNFALYQIQLFQLLQQI